MPPDAESKVDYLVLTDARVTAAWSAFCEARGVPVATDYQVWHFGDSAELTHQLIELVIHGDRRGTAGLAAMLDTHLELAGVPGGDNVVTEYDGAPRVVTRSVEIKRCGFEDVDAQFTWDEGEGDRTLAWWRDAHWAYFKRECAALGLEPSPRMEVVLERFELLWVVAG